MSFFQFLESFPSAHLAFLASRMTSAFWDDFFFSKLLKIL